MSRQSLTAVRSQAGFTLVELAVVMIIIGLLIGGVLKGQELITNAQLTSTVAQVKGIDAATTTFKDMYNAMPGDMLTPDTRLSNCAAGTVCARAGDGNGRLNNAPNATPVGAEGEAFFVHLAAADVFTGINPAGAAGAWGGLFPAAKIAGGFQAGYTNGGAGTLVANNANLMGGHYLTLTLSPGAPTADTGAISPNQALRIDSKIDDGNGSTGGARSFGTSCDTAGVYNEQSGNKVCGLHIRFQG